MRKKDLEPLADRLGVTSSYLQKVIRLGVGVGDIETVVDAIAALGMTPGSDGNIPIQLIVDIWNQCDGDPELYEQVVAQAQDETGSPKERLIAGAGRVLLWDFSDNTYSNDALEEY